MKRCIVFFLLSLFVVPTAMALSFEPAKLAQYVELDWREGLTQGKRSEFVGMNFSYGRKQANVRSFSIASMSANARLENGEEALSRLFYAGPRMRISYRQHRRMNLELYAVVAIGSAEYEKRSGNVSEFSEGMFVGLQPGVRLYWRAKSKWWLATGLSALSGSIEHGANIDGGPYFDVGLRYQW
jgi:hypothetical protein